jgi:hypothetical protein
MIAILLSALFTASALFAVRELAGAWRRYTTAFRDLRLQLAALDDDREVRVRTREVSVTAIATVLRPEFKVRQPRPAQPALPAAA